MQLFTALADLGLKFFIFFILSKTFLLTGSNINILKWPRQRHNLKLIVDLKEAKD